MENQQVHIHDLQKGNKLNEKTYTTNPKELQTAERVSWQWLEEEPNQRQGEIR